MSLFYIFLRGVLLLFFAIILNMTASHVGLVNWYDFLREDVAISTLSFFWLFVFYPFILGLLVYYISEWFN